jgi:small lipoprotein (TIGR04454 family)
MRWFVVLAVVAACSKKTDEGPPCSAVVDNLMAVTKTQMAGHGGMEVQNRKAMLDQCETHKMPAAQRSCLVAAKDFTAISTCMKPAPSSQP